MSSRNGPDASADDTLECFDSWILITMLASRDRFCKPRASQLASDLSARDQTHAFFFPDRSESSTVLYIRAFYRW